MLPRQMGHKKIDPRMSTFFGSKVFENITADNNTDLTATL